MKETDLKTLALTNIENIAFSSIKDFSRLTGGGNNRLYKITAENNEEFLLKEYQPDDRQRLSREYGSFQFLRERGFRQVPIPFFKNQENNYAIYSFENGLVLDAGSLSKTEIDQIVSFLTELHGIKPSKPNRNSFLEALFATCSLNEFADTVLFKFGKFEESLISGNLHPKAIRLAEEYPLSKLVRGTIKKLSYKESDIQDMFQPIKPSEKRLSPVDFGPHNMITRNNGELCFIDFEYFGWDDPVKIVANFVFHEGSKGISNDQKHYFLARFKQQSGLPTPILKRIDVALPLAALDWLSILLWGITPEKISSKKFLSASFDTESYLDDQLGKIVHRIRELKNLDEKGLIF